ncbi:GNAT family N-acetyltransferase [Amphritea balenae]|uniref:GNAT family N-acetyltransferase n=1 Tax=Amphritea balenae TaxID=452629 RepID=A0A3P1SS35_9GAMM|nr:GNAT family N-acetyltransferase [Amphritea balenae]RRC99988.1 GNAT family N-acetyltransferase [Amphritea balenae]GGK75651.1 N-acetyltransferase [Amphritea balenae]
MSELNIRTVREQDLERCFEIEITAYSGDEAASKEKILKRIRTYPEGFIVLENDQEIIGFINAGASHKVEMSDEAFKEMVGHDPDGKYVVIMSVVIHPDYQRQKLAGKLMQEFIGRMRRLDKSEIYLICQQHLIGMYAGFGYREIGESDSDHGGLSWYEMSLTL